jgi:SAM-dependent methyltransferase
LATSAEFIQEIYRVLKPKGLLAIGFADQNFMETLPFTVYNFNLYSKEKVRELAESVNFRVLDIKPFNELITGKTGEVIERLFYVALLEKA